MEDTVLKSVKKNLRKQMNSTKGSKFLSEAGFNSINESCQNFEIEPKSSSNFALYWKIGRDSLIVCLGFKHEVLAKITQRIILFIVSAVFDWLEICSSFTIRMRFLLKSFRALIRQAWEKDLSAEHSSLSSDCCSELREIKTMSIKQFILKPVV